MNNASYLKSALIGGVVIGVLSSVPFVSAGNCLCCMYVWGGAILAAYLYFKDSPFGTLGDGALVGLLTGIVGAVITTVASIPLMLLGFGQGSSMEGMPPEAMQALEQAPEQVLQFMDAMFNREPGAVLIASAMGLVFNLAIFSLIGTLGGMIGASMFRDKTQQYVPPPQ